MTTGNKTTSNATPPDTVLVVGATSSLAQALCRTLARAGYTLVLSARDETELELLAADLRTRFGAICQTLLADLLEPSFSAITFIAQAGDFKHAVLAVGDMGNGDPDDPANINTVARINYILPAQIAAAAAQQLGEAHGGSITIISSVAGDRGRQSNYAYGSAKAAINAFASGLRNRYCAQGIHVMTVKPGFIDTPMTWGMKSPLIAGREYVAEKIVGAMESGKDVIYVPFFWRYIMLIIRTIPERVFKWMKL